MNRPLSLMFFVLIVTSAILLFAPINSNAQDQWQATFPDSAVIRAENVQNIGVIAEYTAILPINQVEWSSDGSGFALGGDVYDIDVLPLHLFAFNEGRLLLTDKLNFSASDFSYVGSNLDIVYTSSDGIRMTTIRSLLDQEILIQDIPESPFTSPYMVFDVNSSEDFLVAGRHSGGTLSVFQVDDWRAISIREYAQIDVGEGIPSVAIHPTEPIVAYGQLYNDLHILYLWNFEENIIQQLSIPSNTFYTKEIVGIAFHPNGRYVASGDCDGRMVLWSLDTMDMVPLSGDPIVPEVLEEQYSDPRCISAIAFSPDGRLLVQNSGNTVDFENPRFRLVFWDIETLNYVGSIEIPASYYPSIAFHPNGRILAISTDNTVSFLGVLEE